MEELPRLLAFTTNATALYNGNEIPYYLMRQHLTNHSFHPDLPETEVFGIEESVPGPLIVANVNSPVFVQWLNLLPEEHILPVDTTILSQDQTDAVVYSVTTLHGAFSDEAFDGLPDDWVASGGNESYFAFYDNSHEAALVSGSLS